MRDRDHRMRKTVLVLATAGAAIAVASTVGASVAGYLHVQRQRAAELVRSDARFAHAAGYVDQIGGDIYVTDGVLDTAFGMFDQDKDGYFWWFRKDGTKLHEARFRTNNAGFLSNRRYDFAAGALQYRIVVAGDEMAAATTGSDLWPDRVEDLLNAVPEVTGAVGEVRVINVAHPDMFPSDLVTVAIELGLPFDPDLFLVNLPEHSFYRIQPNQYLTESELVDPARAEREWPAVPVGGRWIDLDAPDGSRAQILVTCWGGATSLADARCDTGFPVALLFHGGTAPQMANNPAVVRGLLDSFSRQYADGIVATLSAADLLLGRFNAADLLARRPPVPLVETTGPRSRAPTESDLVANVRRQLRRLADRFPDVLVLQNPFYPHVTGTPLRFSDMLAKMDPAVAPLDTRPRLLARLGKDDPQVLWTVPAAAEKWSRRGHFVYAEVVAEKVIANMVAKGVLAPLDPAQAVDRAVTVLAVGTKQANKGPLRPEDGEVAAWAAEMAFVAGAPAERPVAARIGHLAAKSHVPFGEVRRLVAGVQGLAAVNRGAAVENIPALAQGLEHAPTTTADWAWNRLARTFSTLGDNETARALCARIRDRVIAESACVVISRNDFNPERVAVAFPGDLPDGDLAIRLRALNRTLLESRELKAVEELFKPLPQLLERVRFRWTTWLNVVLPSVWAISKAQLPIDTPAADVRRWWETLSVASLPRSILELGCAIDLLRRDASDMAAAVALGAQRNRFGDLAAAAVVLAAPAHPQSRGLIDRVMTPDIRAALLARLIAMGPSTHIALGQSLAGAIEAMPFPDLRLAAIVDALRQRAMPPEIVDRLLSLAGAQFTAMPAGMARDRLHAELAVAAAAQKRDADALAAIRAVLPGVYRDVKLAELALALDGRPAAAEALALRSVPVLAKLPAAELWRAAAPRPLKATHPIALWTPGFPLPE
jgi:hypothetical protein